MRFPLPKLLLLAAPVFAVSQVPTPASDLQTPLQMRAVPAPKNMKWDKEHGKAFLNSNVGSFKLMANDEKPAEGTLDMAFEGTVLISNLDPDSTVVVSGNIRKEIDDTATHRMVYFGSGRITLCGKFRAVQFFGRHLRAAFDGNAYGRLYGEFDKNLDTGYYWYDGRAEKMPWSNGGSTLAIPTGGQVKLKVKVKGG